MNRRFGFILYHKFIVTLEFLTKTLENDDDIDQNAKLHHRIVKVASIFDRNLLSQKITFISC